MCIFSWVLCVSTVLGYLQLFLGVIRVKVRSRRAVLYGLGQVGALVARLPTCHKYNMFLTPVVQFQTMCIRQKAWVQAIGWRGLHLSRRARKEWSIDELINCNEAQATEKVHWGHFVAPVLGPKNVVFFLQQILLTITSFETPVKIRFFLVIFPFFRA